MYQRILLSSGAKVGDAGDLPPALVGLSDAHLANLPAALTPCPAEWVDTGFLPVDVAVQVQNFVVDVPSFMLRFTAPERIAIRKSADPVVEDFMALLNDPRTTHVNLALDQVQQAVGYLAGEGGSPLNPPLIDPSRVAAILASA